MKSKKKLNVIFCCLLWTSGVFAQDKVSFSLTNASFLEFVKSVELSSNYHFYFDPRWTDSLSVTLTITDGILKDVLTELLRPTDLSFAITPDQKVFITRNRVLLTKLAKGVIPRQRFSLDENYDASAFDKKVKKADNDEGKVYVLGSKSSGLIGNATISGIVRDAANGEPMPGVTVILPNPLTGTATDVSGKYSLTIPKGKRIITIQSVGMETTQRTLMLYGDGKLDIELKEEITPLKEVIVNADQEASVTGLQMGKEKLDIRSMKQMPLALGETDVLKVVLTLPGVQTVGEGTNGLNVRGGASNQNLILFNGATVYNPSHLFGFFSTFNPDVLKSLELYKSGFEANIGGRLSSVLDVTAREGNLKKFTFTGGLSPITGRLTIEGPIIKDKTSFLISGRSTYSDWILNQLESSQFKNSTASFYDLNLNIGHKINDNNHLTFSAYMSSDEFKLKSDTLYSYSDRNGSLKWWHRFNSKLFADLTITMSDYRFSMSSEQNPINAFSLDYRIKQYQAKADFNYILNKKNTFHFGLTSILYRLSPGSYLPKGDSSVVSPDVLQNEQGVESALYIGDNIELSPKVSLYVGVRYSLFSFLGSQLVYQYNPDQPVEVTNIVDTTQYGGGSIKSYHGLEPRLTARYLIDKNTSIKFSYGRTRQYIQMLSNNTAIAPTDIWKLSDLHIKPQIADQVSLGLFRNWSGGLYEFSVEGYYKLLSQATDYQDGAVLIRNHHIETDILNAKGKSYGAEFMVRKSTGRLNGWISYTWSRSFLKADSKFEIERVNKGQYYRSNFDKPHAVNVITNYKFNRRINLSLNITYSTGRPITLPVAKYELNGVSRIVYSGRNEFRVPDYFRSDISINFEGNHKVKKFAHSSWTFAVYNLTGRRNAYSIFFRTEDAQIKGYKLSVFGQAIPTITYNFKI
jgi:hypothetical protein